MLFNFGAVKVSFLNKENKHTITPLKINRILANIIISGIELAFILKALYPIFTIGKSEPQRAVTIRLKAIVLKFFILIPNNF